MGLIVDKKDVRTRVFVHDLAGKRVRELPVAEAANITATSYNLDRDVVYATLASFTSPPRVSTIDGRSLAVAPLWEDNPPVGTSAIAVELRFAPAVDGAKIPVFVVHRKDWVVDGRAPTYLYGYGGFNIGVEPFFLGTLAAVQKNPGQTSPFLLYMDFDNGHGYGKARQKIIEDRDISLRFLMNELGMNAGAAVVNDPPPGTGAALSRSH